jgi:uncharacterized membrane protein YbhN (UPF0104 family)
MENSLPANEAPSRDAGDARAPRPHAYRAFAMRIGLGIAIVGFLLWHYDARPALHSLAREQPLNFAAAVAIYVAGQILSAWRWQLLAAVLNLRGPFAEFLRYYFIGVFTNLFLPGLVGGDAARAFYLGRRHGQMGEAIASALADRGYGFLALFWLAALIAMTMNHGALPPNIVRPIIAAGIVTVAGYLASPLIARLVHFTPRPIRRALGIIAPFLHKPMAVLPAIILSMVLQSSLAVAQYVLALGLGLHLPLSTFLLIVPISGALASLPITLNGLGLRETAYLFLFGMAGMGRDDAIALGLLFFAALMVGGLFGAVAFVTTEVPKPLSSADSEPANAI